MRWRRPRTIVAALVLGLLGSYFSGFVEGWFYSFPPTSKPTQHILIWQQNGVWWSGFEMRSRWSSTLNLSPFETEEAARRETQSYQQALSLLPNPYWTMNLSRIGRPPPGWARPDLVSVDESDLLRNNADSLSVPSLTRESSLYHWYTETYIGHGVGWPMLAWSGHTILSMANQQETMTTYGCIAENANWPITPIFPGVIVNTLLFALPWYFLFLGVGSFQRSRRRKRGLCVNCKYDLSGSTDTCPECGSPIARKPQPQDA